MSFNEKKIFIDGEEGTTGLQIYKKLSVHPEIEILKIKEKDRKDPIIRQNLMELSDLTFCVCQTKHPKKL